MAETALAWIVKVLNDRMCPFAVCGGLAARFYGVDRPLNDIDIFVPAACFQAVVDAGAQYISKPAQHYCEAAEGWDLEYVQFLYAGTKIEVGNARQVNIYERALARWRPLVVDFDSTVSGVILGSRVSVMPKTDLMRYKTQLGRDVDLQDVSVLTQ
jgi:hypothetical protein